MIDPLRVIIIPAFHPKVQGTFHPKVRVIQLVHIGLHLYMVVINIFKLVLQEK